MEYLLLDRTWFLTPVRNFRGCKDNPFLPIPQVFLQIIWNFQNTSYLCPRNHIINIKSTLLWTNYKTFKITSISSAVIV